MKLVITSFRLKLLMYCNAGYIRLDDEGEAILSYPGSRARRVTYQMDALESFGLVHVTIHDRVYSLTERGASLINGEGRNT